jgi:photosynthetic reaction center cytochrome c subunit
MILLVAAISLLSLVALSAGHGWPPPTQTTAPQLPPGTIAGADRCIFCHQTEVEGYARSSMAHALRRSSQEPAGDVSLPTAKISATNRPDGYHQALEASGQSQDYKVDYVIGSGNHASGYLISLGGHLFQSPIAYYRTRRSYDVAPGYEGIPHPDFTRPVGEACVFCHSGTALPIPNTLNQFRQPPFAAESITCERCHGPVERHLSDPRAGTIVNPANLAPAARDSTCEQCHLFGVARVPNPGKQFSDFLPGQPLEQTFSIYRNAIPAGSSAGTFKVISHVEQLALSHCARSSNQKLWCGTCHDPHNKPAEPVAYYREKCLACHASDFDTRIASSHPVKNSDCVSCHMPRRDAKDGGHTAFTDHRIQRRPEPESDLPAGTDIVAWREPAAALQKRNLGIAHIDAGVGRRSQSMVIQGYRELAEVQSQFPNDPELFSWIGQALVLGHQSREAEIAFERAAQLAPTSPVNEGNAASAYAQAGDLDSARVHLEKAVAIDPLYLPAAGPLVQLYRRQGRTTEAEALTARIETLMHPPSISASADSASRSAPNASASSAGKTVEQVFKNIQVLKDTPSGQIFPAMEFISSSLGVRCTFCHVEEHFDKDDKKPKQTARAMMRMTLALNKNNFGSRREITCYSCHRGAQHPADIPAVAGSCSGELASANGCNNTTNSPSSTTPTTATGSPPARDTAPLPVNLPTVSEILDRYVAALGGAEALQKITTRIEKGLAIFGTVSTPIEIFTAATQKQSIVRHLAQGDSLTTIGNNSAWFLMPGRPARPIQGADLDGALLDADLQFPLHLRQIFPELGREYPETIAGREAYVLIGIREGQPTVKFYFDESTGLLIRQIRYADSPFGPNPTQIDYSDYRAADGVQIAFRRTTSVPSGKSVVQIDHLQQNTPIANSVFASPAPR